MIPGIGRLHIEEAADRRLIGGFTGSDPEQEAVVRVIERLAQRRGGVDRAAHTSESRRLTPAHLWARPLTDHRLTIS